LDYPERSGVPPRRPSFYDEQVRAVDPTVPSIARVYDYWLGGKDNFAADRQLALEMCEINPRVPEMARSNRAFAVAAAVRAARAGVTQFLDLGAGLPTQPSVDEAVRAVNPDGRVAYVDNDPVAVTHARALLACWPGVSAAPADLADAAAVLDHPEVCRMIDLDQPVCVIMAYVLHFYDTNKARAVTAAYMDRAAPGSWIAASVSCVVSERLLEIPPSAYTAGTYFNHGARDLARWLAGWDLIPPGISEARLWVCGTGGFPPGADSYVLCAAASKPRLQWGSYEQTQGSLYRRVGRHLVGMRARGGRRGDRPVRPQQGTDHHAAIARRRDALAGGRAVTGLRSGCDWRS
jgi:S-adenosyl methyltransferase